VRPRHDISGVQEAVKVLRGGEDSRNTSAHLNNNLNNDQTQIHQIFNSCDKAEIKPPKVGLPMPSNSYEATHAMAMVNGKQIRVTPRLQRKGASLDAVQRSNHYSQVSD
jgi:hypothetical protein